MKGFRRRMIPFRPVEASRRLMLHSLKRNWSSCSNMSLMVPTRTGLKIMVSLDLWNLLVKGAITPVWRMYLTRGGRGIFLLIRGSDEKFSLIWTNNTGKRLKRLPAQTISRTCNTLSQNQICWINTTTKNSTQTAFSTSGSRLPPQRTSWWTTTPQRTRAMKMNQS